MAILTTDQIDALIQAKYTLLADIITKLTDLIANPQISYSIDGESWDFNAYQNWLGELQVKETKALDDLLELRIKYAGPYQYQSNMY